MCRRTMDFPGKTTERTVGMTEIHAPKPVCDALRLLHQNGFSAYAVGGCVRDSLLGLSPEDWDLTTSARPEETERVFADFRVVETGLRHGTVTVLAEGLPLEITTYRIDGAYADMRRPEQVTFSTKLREDLARRDLAVHSICFDFGIPNRGCNVRQSAVQSLSSAKHFRRTHPCGIHKATVWGTRIKGAGKVPFGRGGVHPRAFRACRLRAKHAISLL